MIAALAGIFVFLAAGSGAGAVFLPRRLAPAEARLRALRPADEPAHEEASLRRTHSAIPMLGRWLNGRGWADDVGLRLQRANVQLRVAEFVLVRLLLAAAGFLTPLLLLGPSPASLIAGLAAAIGGAMAPPAWLSWTIRKRLRAIERQLVDLVPTLGSSLRAGFGFQQAVEIAAEQMGPPLSEELALLLNDVNLGAGMEVALLDFGQRVGSADLDMIITAILVQRTTGGNLSEVLDHASETMSERERIRGDIMTMTAAQRMSGTILSVYPVLIGLILLAIMPSMWTKMFTETLGQVLLGTAFAMQALGFLLIRRALRVDI